MRVLIALRSHFLSLLYLVPDFSLFSLSLCAQTPITEEYMDGRDLYWESAWLSLQSFMLYIFSSLLHQLC